MHEMRLAILIQDVSIEVIEKPSKITVLIFMKKSQGVLCSYLPAFSVNYSQILEEKWSLYDILGIHSWKSLLDFTETFQNNRMIVPVMLLVLVTTG